MGSLEDAMKILYVHHIDLLALQGQRGRDLASIIELAIRTGQKTITATSVGFFVLGGAR